jgi:hypothetical protein
MAPWRAHQQTTHLADFWRHCIGLGQDQHQYKEKLGQAKEDDGENGSGEDLHLIGDLGGGGFQIRGGNKLKIILDNCSQEASGDI